MANRGLSLGQLVAPICGLPAPLDGPNNSFTPLVPTLQAPLHESALSGKEVMLVKSKLYAPEMEQKLRGSGFIAMHAQSGLKRFLDGEMDFMVVRTSRSIAQVVRYRQGCATGRPADRPTSGFFHVFEKSRQNLKKPGQSFEKS
jgi:hypothetical protein